MIIRLCGVLRLFYTHTAQEDEYIQMRVEHTVEALVAI